MSDTAIQVENLSKRYILRHQTSGGYVALRDVLAKKVASFSQRDKVAPENREEFWALTDVSFSVKQGEVLGIIGRNGAGKSTLLKILSRITEPSSGRIEITGRVSSLLEVGTGFHPELTGRENIYLNGAILGMSRKEIKGKFDEIVAFAEVEKFLDTPVKHYSSGMYVRLAFAVAAHLEPEILIVDEVLAVGDVQFQKKCLGKMQDVAQREGRTVLFVSHNMAAISSLTNRLVVLNKGKLEYEGGVQKGIDFYLSTETQKTGVYQSPSSGQHPNITLVEILCSEPGQVQNSGKPWAVKFQIHYPVRIPKACLSFQIINQYQVPVLHFCAYDFDVHICLGQGTTSVTCKIPELNLNVGSYSLKVYFSEPPGGRGFEILEGICPFEVIVLNRTTLFGWRPDACTYFESGTWTADKSQV